MFEGTSINPLHSLTLGGLVLAPIVGFLYFPPTTALMGVGVLTFIWFGLSSSLFYHRVLAHRAAKLVGPLELLFLLGGLIGLSGDPVQWVAIHRFHHSNSDKAIDPHSPLKGWWYSFFGWYLRIHPKKVDHLLPLAKDIQDRKLYRLAAGYGPTTILHLIFAAGLYAWGGLGAVIWVLYVPVLISCVSSKHLGHPRLGC